MGNRIVLFLLLVALLSYTCATKRKELHKQSLETAYIEGNYETIFRAVRTVFQNDAFVIEQSDFQSGFLLFTKRVPIKSSEKSPEKKPRKRSWGFCCLGCFGRRHSSKDDNRKYKTIKASVTLNNLGKETEVRIGFIGLEMDEHDYGVMLKRTFAEVRKQVLIREGN